MQPDLVVTVDAEVGCGQLKQGGDGHGGGGGELHLDDCVLSDEQRATSDDELSRLTVVDRSDTVD